MGAALYWHSKSKINLNLRAVLRINQINSLDVATRSALCKGLHKDGDQAMNLPSVNSAKLPQTYEVAKQALSDCQNLDECKDWSDKAEALASYAKQAGDDTLMKMATRIKARAIRRSGELLKQIEPGQGARDGKRGAGDHTPFTRESAAQEAGMSKHQQVQATRVASVPQDDFETQVEGDKPPTISRLAEQGTKRNIVDLKGRDPREFSRSTQLLGFFEYYARELSKKNIEEDCDILTDDERKKLRRIIEKIDETHDIVMTRI